MYAHAWAFACCSHLHALHLGHISICPPRGQHCNQVWQYTGSRVVLDGGKVASNPNASLLVPIHKGIQEFALQASARTAGDVDAQLAHVGWGRTCIGRAGQAEQQQGTRMPPLTRGEAAAAMLHLLLCTKRLAVCSWAKVVKSMFVLSTLAAALKVAVHRYSVVDTVNVKLHPRAVSKRS
jgi:hypothetical protein